MPEIRTWSGIITGAVTPFSDDGAIDWDSYERHLQELVGTGLTGLLVNAMMSEGGHLSEAERDGTLRFAIGRVGATLPVIATIYGANTDAAVAEATRAEKAGAAALLVVPHPAFGGAPLDPEMPAAYFGAIARASALPMIAFRTPATLSPTFGIEIMKRLCDVPGVVAIKDSVAEADFYHGDGARFLVPDSPLKILIDSDLKILDFLKMGVHGATSICACLNPRSYVRMFDNRHHDVATGLQEALLPLANAVYAPPFRDFRARLKEILAAGGIFTNARVRPPLMPLANEERARMLTALKSTQDRIDRFVGLAAK
ncbi:MAG: dihydrodipicolinate synthase family protein [Rhizobiales bacterium]|nr:dihydrodipicolinate synthase family protein [Hyphomicrobiales bacterium]